MRYDIGYNVASDELILKQSDSILQADNAIWSVIDNILVLQVYVAQDITDEALNNTGVLVDIPYYEAENLQFAVAFYRYDPEQEQYVICHPAGDNEFVPAFASVYGASENRIKSWETRLLGVSGQCVVTAKTDRAHIGSVPMDLMLRNVDNQDAYLLLKSEPGAMLRYPLTGVGVIKWTNSPGNASELYAAIRREIQGDGLTIQNMFYSPERGLTLRVTSDGNV